MNTAEEEKKVLFETLPYRVASSKYFKVIFCKLLTRWLSIVILLLTALIGATCYDLRFGIVLLMFIFIILPLALFMFYYNYALRPVAFFSVVEKSVIIHTRGIDCIYDEKQREVLQWQQVERVERNNEAFYIYTDANTYFYLPRQAFATADDIQDFEKNYLPQFIS